jgi:hypothetical protein
MVIPGDHFVLCCWFLTMFGLGFIAGLLAAWWIAIEQRSRAKRHQDL